MFLHTSTGGNLAVQDLSSWAGSDVANYDMSHVPRLNESCHTYDVAKYDRLWTRDVKTDSFMCDMTHVRASDMYVCVKTYIYVCIYV